ncbi:MAG: FliA/WhiG family RNA polymerase sigma factor [Planctomycetaceae bacterium]|nr:FliA/WhiG family RNA polymerase sigma factor [Planctomycetaceae bacterium]
MAKTQAKAPRSTRAAAAPPAKTTRKPAPLQKAPSKAAPKSAAKGEPKAGSKAAPKAVPSAKGPTKAKAKTAVTPAAKLPRETTKQTQGKMRGKDSKSPSAQPGAALPTKSKSTKSGSASRGAAATQVVASRATAAAARTQPAAPKAALPQRARLAAEMAQAKADANDPTKAPAPQAAATESEAAAPAASAYFTEPEVPKGPFAEHTTEDLWVLYRAEADRLKLAEDSANAEADEELDEEAELRRLVEEERAEREREAALARGETPDLGGDSEATEAAPEVQFVQRPGGRRERNSPVLERLRNELIERHYPLVRYIAERLLQTLPKSIELDDLVSAGQFGLMDAIRGFDPSRGIKFKTYCSTRIRGSILDQLRSQDWVPRLVRLKATRIDKALQRLTGEFGREPTHAELARALEMEHGELAAELMESQARTMFSLSEKWDDDDEGSVEKVEILEDRAAIDPVHELNRRDLMVFMTRSLTHKERFIIEQYYQYGHTMREIGEMLTLTESRVCQIHSNVMGRLKGLLAQRGDTLSS